MTARQRDLVTANLSNPQHNVTRLEQQAALRAIKREKRPAIIAVQEANAKLRAPIGYRKFSGPGGISELALFVKRGVTVVGHGSHKSVDGKAGHWPDRGFVWVQLAEGLTVFCTHPNSKIDYAGGPLRGQAWDVTRDQLFPDLDAAIALHSRTGQVVVVGDWNVDRRADRKKRNAAFPFMRMRRHGMAEAIYPGGSLGKRAVDRAFYEANGLRLVRCGLMKKRARYDHRWLWLRLRHTGPAS